METIFIWYRNCHQVQMVPNNLNENAIVEVFWINGRWPVVTIVVVHKRAKIKEKSVNYTFHREYGTI